MEDHGVSAPSGAWLFEKSRSFRVERATTLHRVSRCCNLLGPRPARRTRGNSRTWKSVPLEAGGASLRRTFGVTRKNITGTSAHPSKPCRIPGVSQCRSPENQGSGPRSARKRRHTAAPTTVSCAVDPAVEATAAPTSPGAGRGRRPGTAPRRRPTSRGRRARPDHRCGRAARGARSTRVRRAPGRAGPSGPCRPR